MILELNGKTKLDELLKANQKYIEREQNKNIALDSIPQFSDKQEYEEGVVVYRIEDSLEGMNAVRKIVDAQWGKKANPWCLITPPMNDAWKYWCTYNGFPKQIAFQNGKLLAFRANRMSKNNLWWNREDQSSEELETLDGKTLSIPTLKWSPKNRIERLALKWHLIYNKETQRYDSSSNLTLGNEDLINGEIPVPLGVINGEFDISYCNELKNLDNGPIHVWGRLNTYRVPSKVIKASQMWKNYQNEAAQRCIKVNNLKLNKKTYYSNEKVWIWDYMIVDGKLPITFDYVKKDFKCSYNKKLLSLEGFPRQIGGDLDLGNCQNLTSLKGGPRIVKGDYDVWKCKNLADSTGCPEEIGGSFDYRGCPKEFENSADFKRYVSGKGNYVFNKLIKKYKLVLNEQTGRYDCNSKEDIRLHSQDVVDGHLPLKFGKVVGGFDCSMSNLISCEEMPTWVGGRFDIGYNYDMVSLKGCPKYVGGDFDCTSLYELKSLQGAPQYVGGDLDLERCYKLTSLKGGPKEIGGDLNCDECKQLVSLLDDGPQKIKHDIIIKRCPSLSMKERNQFKRKVSH